MKILNIIMLIATLLAVWTGHERLVTFTITYWAIMFGFVVLITIITSIESFLKHRSDKNLIEEMKAIAEAHRKEMEKKAFKKNDRAVPDTKTEKRILKVKKAK